MNEDNKVKVWDIFIRFFHWSLLMSICLLYVTAQSGMQVLHPLIGYFITAILLIRILWGFIGTSHARFSNFVHSPKAILDYMKDIFKGHPERHIGHNPAGGIMVVALMFCAGRMYDGKTRTGFIAASLFIMSPVAIFHAQNARPYILLALLTAVHLILFIRMYFMEACASIRQTPHT